MKEIKKYCVCFYKSPSEVKKALRGNFGDELSIISTNREHNLDSNEALKSENNIYEFSGYLRAMEHMIENDIAVSTIFNDTVLMNRSQFLIGAGSYFLEYALSKQPVLIGSLEKGLPGLGSYKGPLSPYFVRSNCFTINRAAAILARDMLIEFSDKTFDDQLNSEIEAFTTYRYSHFHHSRKIIAIRLEQELSRIIYQKGMIIPIQSLFRFRVLSMLNAFKEKL